MLYNDRPNVLGERQTADGLRQFSKSLLEGLKCLSQGMVYLKILVKMQEALVELYRQSQQPCCTILDVEFSSTLERDFALLATLKNVRLVYAVLPKGEKSLTVMVPYTIGSNEIRRLVDKEVAAMHSPVMVQEPEFAIA